MAFTDWIADEQLDEVEIEEDVTNEEVSEVEETIEEKIVEEAPQEEVAPPTPQTFNIGGKELTLAEIETGYMRQQDYLAKIEEANKLKEESKQALELVDYIKKNPEVAQRLMSEENVPSNISSSINPAMERIEKLEKQLYIKEMDATLNGLKMKYPDFNEIEVLNRAVQLNTSDLEFVYHGLRGANMDNIIAQKVKEQLAQATQEMAKNSQSTRTVVGNTKHSEVATTTHNLTKQQMRVADMMGISYEDYAKYL